MPAKKTVYVYAVFVYLMLFVTGTAFSQCTVQQGPAPANYTFNTGGNGQVGSVPPGSPDLHWTVTMDSINGVYAPAIVMSNEPDVYYKSPYSNCKWISISANGQHSGDRNIFFKMDFDLPCSNPCGKPFAGIYAFQLNLDLFADNSIHEIFVNGQPQSGSLGGILPAPGGYSGAGSSASGGITVSLSKGWRPGTNTIIVQVASSAPIVGLLTQASVKQQPPLTDTIKASVCEGKIYKFGAQQLTEPGTYIETFHPAPGCDSSVTLLLTVVPKAVTVDTSICQGENYFGHTASGTYTDTYTSSTGCDSVRTVHLTVFTNPHPNIEKDSILCMGDSLIISPGTFISYEWQDGSTLDHYVVKKPGLYSVTVTSTCGALKSAVYVNEVSCTYIGFPTAFSPNQDGRNDLFKILTHQTLPGYDLVVYNRFGQKIFETRDPAKGWDGNFNGKQQGTGSYVWFCTYKKGDAVIKMQGTVVLIR